MTSVLLDERNLNLINMIESEPSDIFVTYGSAHLYCGNLENNVPELSDRKIIIFDNAVLFDFFILHITDVLSGNIPKMCLDPSSDVYINDSLINDITKAYLENKEAYPNEAFYSWSELQDQQVPTYLAGFAIKNTTVIETILASDEYSAKIGLSGNVNLPTEYLISLFNDKDTDLTIRIGIAKHKNLNKDAFKLFVNETNYLVISTLSQRKDIVDKDLLDYIAQYGSKEMKEEFYL